jgi:hypothetical protein
MQPTDGFWLSGLGPRQLPRLLRHTMVTALVLGGVAFAVAILLNQGFVALGVAVGLVGAWLNHRVLDRNVARVDTDGSSTANKVARRAIGARTIGRLGTLTAAAVVLLVLKPPIGLGLVIGLVIFQLAFVANAARVIMSGSAE